MSLEKLVIINGDDFGYSDGAELGINLAYREGVLTSTSVMANLLSGNELLQRYGSSVPKPPLGVGVHLNLTFGKPLRTDLFGGQDFTRPLRGQDPNCEWLNSVWVEYFKRYNPGDVLEEYRAQIERVYQVLGHIDHVDSHHGSDYYVGSAYLDVARQYGVGARPSSPLSEVSIEGGDFQEDPTFFERAKKASVATVTRLVMDYFYRYDDPQQAFFESLASIQPGEVVEYMFHPSVDGNNGDWRIKDLEVLTDPRTIKRIEELGITLATYGSSARVPGS